MMTLCTNMDPVTGDHKFRARQGRVIQSVVLPVLPATKYQASGSCAHRPARSRYPRDNARHSGRGSSRSVSPRRRGRSRSVDRRHKGEYEHDDLLCFDDMDDMDDGRNAGPSSSKGKQRDPAERGFGEFRSAEPSFFKGEPPPETIPAAELVQLTANALEQRILAVTGASAQSSEAQTQRRAVEIMESDVDRSNGWPPEDFGVASRCLTEHTKVAVTYARTSVASRRTTFLKEAMEHLEYHLAR
ncbi:hypothetical protein BDV98DRAFT_608187 [Pterulicium gracile]|uniref:Uncharacterized protein n=1 Tax=Pterulicium gracile TaxID=1884261 RepID=A0A5C3Q441_9AGAR|nr:hypothetical protein BDV98DRAFT_608187 [Pterula gracilis]